ncbi:MAG TPA: glycosyltransferase family 39 protein [Aggregatilineales bacterium]|nr:glycosyltransferase family 39 protein [Aggregatilineales bacterium]
MLLGWSILGFMLVAAWPWARWIAARSASDEDQLLLSLLLCIGLGSGVLSLLMLWVGLFGIRLETALITGLYAVVMVPGWIRWWRERKHVPGKLEHKPLHRWQWFALVSISLICAGIVFNAAYWPFSKADTLGIYHRYGTLIFETGALVPFAGRDDAFYQAYPMHLPLIYAFSYMVSGQINEYLARVIPALLAIGCVPTVYLIGKTVGGKQAGWISAFLLATTPTFVRWASSGYVDLPMAFYYTLAALFTLRLIQHQRTIDALLVGVMLGLAAWTKNAALVGIGLMALWALFALWQRWIRLQQILIAGLACAIIAGPWYIRNWIEARLIVPPTAWIDQAQHNLQTFLAFITHPTDFGLTGWVVFGAVILVSIRLITHSSPGRAVSEIWGKKFHAGGHTAPTIRPPQQPFGAESRSTVLLLWLTIPFFGIWWWLASYDLRFLLLFLPLLTVIAGGVSWQLWATLLRPFQSRLRYALLLIAIVLAGVSLWLSVEFKDDILRQPLMNDSDKRAIVLGES